MSKKTPRRMLHTDALVKVPNSVLKTSLLYLENELGPKLKRLKNRLPSAQDDAEATCFLCGEKAESEVNFLRSHGAELI